MLSTEQENAFQNVRLKFCDLHIAIFTLIITKISRFTITWFDEMESDWFLSVTCGFALL